MSQMTYVFGHQKPDTDSICAAIAYAYLKRETGSPETEACRLGPVNKETQFALDTFGVEAPRLIKSVKPQVSDIHLNNDSMVTEENSIHHTMDLIIDNPGRSLPGPHCPGPGYLDDQCDQCLLRRPCTEQPSGL